jgi:hypothetical protein
MTIGIIYIWCYDTQHTSIEHCYGECHFAECHNNSNVKLSFIMLSVAVFNDVAPPEGHENCHQFFALYFSTSIIHRQGTIPAYNRENTQENSNRKEK